MASTAVFASRAEDGLAVVAAGGYLPFSQADKLECTCLYLCRESRRQVIRTVRVTKATPRTLWCRAEGTSARSDASGLAMYPMVDATLFVENMSRSNANVCRNFLTRENNGGDGDEAHTRRVDSQASSREWQGTANQTTTAGGVPQRHNPVNGGAGCFAGDGGGANLVAARTPSTPTVAAGSLVASRVPLARAINIFWTLPSTELTTRGFRWPDGVEQITFGCLESKHVNRNPSKVLTFGNGPAGSLEPGCVPLPPGLKRIYFGNGWNVDLHGARESWPDSLETLSFARQFNQPLLGGAEVRLPRGLRILELGYYDQSLVGVEWPPLLQSLRFSNYSQSLEGVRFPAGLREIYFGGGFNCEIDHLVWPKGLEILKFGASFNQALVSNGAAGGAKLCRTHHMLPAGLKTLDLGESFYQSLSGSELPDGLEVLYLGYQFDSLASVGWPSRLKQLFVEGSWEVNGLVGEDGKPLPIGLPPKLEALIAGDGFNLPLKMVAWPPTLRVLDLGNEFNDRIGALNRDPTRLPDGLEELRLGRDFNNSIAGMRLPVGLKRLTMKSLSEPDQSVIASTDSQFNQSLVGVMWPPGFEELTLGDSFDQPMKGTTFPETLRKLAFGRAFTHSLKGVALPDGLTHLSFAGTYPDSHRRELDWPRSL